MIYSKTGLELTEQFESCKLTAYQDVKGIWTIGWGHVGKEVCEGLVWTQDTADYWLTQDTLHAQDVINALVKVPLTQEQFDAIVDFAFNCGCAAFAGSTMLKLINSGMLAAAAEEFEKWDHASGVVVAGLLRRRLAEEKEFNDSVAKNSDLLQRLAGGNS